MLTAHPQRWIDNPVLWTKELNSEYIILEKQRFSSRKVKIKGSRIKADKVVIIDDIIASGNTLLESAKLINAKHTYFLAAHGLFAEGALSKLKKKGNVIVSNSIPSIASKIDCTSAIAKAIK